MTSQPAHEDLEKAPVPTEETPLLKGSGATPRPLEYTTQEHYALIPPKGSKLVTSKGVEIIHSGSQVTYVDKKRKVDTIVAHDPESVLGWFSMLRYEGTVFQMSSVIIMLAANAALGALVASLSARFPAITKKGFNTDLLDDLVKFLMSFLAFMTGFFVNSSFSRWQTILAKFFQVFQALKKIYMDMALHGVPRSALQDVRRWGLLSVALVALEAPADWDPPKWDEEYAELSSNGLLNEEERKALQKKVDGNKSTLVWVWIMMKLQECSIQGFVPPRTTPALVKMLDHCHEATTAIDTIHESIIFQVPHQYMHMLAFLIHLFNIVNTVRCGISIGTVYEVVYDEGGRPTAMQVQTVLTSVCIMLLSPFIYQAFLCIALDISIPFGKGNTDLPVPFLLDRFSQEMDDMDACLKDPAPGSALPASRPGTYTGSKFPPSSASPKTVFS
mmetsp:Transcript_47605/g.86040  ORF Transcript_47605/g.86040 Transcript_47605/m.86040 type:complete len:445 (+) Transcript_47605:64-1398(+)